MGKVNRIVSSIVHGAMEYLVGQKLGIGIANVEADGQECAAIIIKGCHWTVAVTDPTQELEYNKGFDDSNIFGGS